jgi:uncharacterized Zn finger protein
LSEVKPYSWTQAICADCWDERHPDRLAVRVLGSPTLETCAYCGHVTKDGIYVRDDPREVAFPRLKEDS